MVSSIFLWVIFVTVYVDILVVLNTLVNYFMLCAVKKIMREKTSRLRIAAGALIGGISSLLIFAESLGAVMTLLKILISFLTILVSFKLTTFKKFLKNTLCLFFICFVFGGLMFAAYMCFGADALIYTNGIVYFDIDMTFLIACSAAAYIIISAVTRFLDKKAPRSKEYFVTVEKNGKTFSCTALMDTGNSLREPFSGYPVVMADKSVFIKLFGDDRPIDKMTAEGGFRLVPVSTVNSEGVAKAFRPDSLSAGEYITDKVYIAESKATLSEYKIILNINLEGEISNAKTENVVR